MKELFTYQFFKRKYCLHPRPLQREHARLASPSTFNTTWQGVLGINGVRPVINPYTQDSDRLKAGVQHAEFKNTCKRLDDRNDGMSRQRATEEILKRFGILNRDAMVEMAVLAERDTGAWNNPESEEEKAQGLAEKGKVERISGKGVESESEGEDELEEELKENEEDGEDVAGKGLRQWTFWF
jgi:hypothetical protein